MSKETKKFTVVLSRVYEVETNPKASDDFIKKDALSQFNNDLQWGFIEENEDCFSAKIIKND